MLSKLKFFSNASPGLLESTRLSIDTAPILIKIEQSNARISRVPDGTLNAGYITEFANEKLFLKTHLHSAGKNALQIEFSILSKLYGGELCVRYLETPDVGGIERGWLVMSCLEPCTQLLDIHDARKLSEDLRARLDEPGLSNIANLPRNTMKDLIKSAWDSYVALRNDEFLSPDVLKKVASSLEILSKQADLLKPKICHGDFGPKNIMTWKKKLYVIDWEDIFWGFEGYDFLYWLTFFSNRKYFSDGVLGFTSLGRELERSVLLMIILIKSNLSRLDNSYKLNKLSFQDRLSEIIGLK